MVGESSDEEIRKEHRKWGNKVLENRNEKKKKTQVVGKKNWKSYLRKEKNNR